MQQAIRESLHETSYSPQASYFTQSMGSQPFTLTPLQPYSPASKYVLPYQPQYTSVPLRAADQNRLPQNPSQEAPPPYHLAVAAASRAVQTFPQASAPPMETEAPPEEHPLVLLSEFNARYQAEQQEKARAERASYDLILAELQGRVPIQRANIEAKVIPEVLPPPAETIVTANSSNGIAEPAVSVTRAPTSLSTNPFTIHGQNSPQAARRVQPPAQTAVKPHAKQPLPA